jgi:microcompartment protein CcmL/EutN
LKLSYKNLVKKRALENGDLVLMVNGKIKNVKARRIKI